MKIALVGYDVEGQASYRYFSADPENEIVIFDEAEKPRGETPSGIEVISGPEAIEKLRGMHFDKVVRTPGLSPRKLGGIANVTSSTREFFAACPAPIIGVTGTKGKGTTVSLINSILQASGRMSWLVGNIGSPALDVLEEVSADDIVVFELSSFQLWDLKQSPHIAVALMIEPDHLDVHADLDEYVDAKANIRRYQKDGDICFYHPQNEYSARIANASQAGEKRRYGIKGDKAVYVKKDTFFIQNDPICGVENLRLPGAHNLENACAAISVAKELGLSNEAIAEGLSGFGGLPHRLKHVRTVRGVDYYDDSIATTPGSAIAALRAFEQPTIIILGGSEKGVNYDEVVQECARHHARVIAIGTTGASIAALCRENGVEVAELGFADMRAIVRQASSQANEGDVVILSPASASFDMFKSYSDRGEQFEEAVRAL